MAVGSGFIHRSNDGGALQQAAAVGQQMSEFRVDAMRPVGIEQERRRAAVRQTEILVGRPFALVHVLIQPRIRTFQQGFRFSHPMSITDGWRTQAVGHDFLLRRGHVIVEKAIQHPRLQCRFRCAGDHASWPG